ncbi:MAG: histidine--tRNA ligase [Candidatus Aenigmatarchaeota archaeon]|nr:MAG: histidine--tRNA ligase [Candidatus Aenigmarchaeota archaeon]
MFQPPRGTRDFFPEEMIKREYVFNTVKAVFERFGFLPTETPAFESWELLAKKGGGIKEEIYYFKDKGERELSLRFDLTVPLARIIASNPQIPKPFKRYQIGRVWRYDRPQAGRFREFWQADIDIIGSERTDADAECVAVGYESLKSLGLKDFIIKINNRKVLNGIMDVLDIENQTEVLRVLDKKEKIGEKDVEKELKELIGNKTKNLLKLIKTKGKLEDIIKQAKNRLENSSLAVSGLEELEELVSLSRVYGVKGLEIDFSLARGLDYYTGPIFEVVLKDKKESIAGGGRYDGLIESCGGRPTPAVGFSLGIERIYEAMISKNLFRTPKTKTKVFVACVDDSVKKNVIEVSQKLRKEGVCVQTDVMGRDLKKQLEFADKNGIPFVILIGEEEVKQKLLTVKEMSKRTQTKASIEKVIEIVKNKA